MKMTPFKKHRYYSEFYTTFTYQIELFPHITICYNNFKIKLISVKWLWFGFYVQRF